MKQAVTKMVQECCKWISEGTLPSKDVELELISTLRTVTEGKIYVEVERARMTHRLSKMKEEEGLVEEASKIMQELQVETYGSMDRKEKVSNIYFWSKSKIALEPVCCKKRQKSPNQETGLGNRGHLKVLKNTKLILIEHERPLLII